MTNTIVKNLKYYLILFLALILVLIWSVYLQEPDTKIHIYIFDVGQGDAELIQKNNFQILVDGGPDNSVITKLGEVMPIEDREIEEVILTHPHADHLSGLIQVLSRYKVKKIVYSGVNYDSSIYSEFSKIISENQIAIEIPTIGQSEITSAGELTYFWPGKNGNNQSDNLNNTSEVFQFDCGEFSAVFSGDCETDCWEKIEEANKKELKNVDYLKISHHGSKNGTNKELIDILKPKFVTISLGKNNKYGFPHKETVDILESSGADIYRTDLLGTIDISIADDGRNWQIKTKK